MGPIATAASRLRWDAFCSLTYSGNRVGETEEGKYHWIRRRMLLEWVRKVEDAFGIPRDHLCYLAREEQGEERGRFHWHALLRGLHHAPGRGAIPSPNPTSDAFRCMSLWESCGNAAGMARVREYDARLSGVSYVLKGLEILEWTYAGANAYELAKFAEEEGRELISAPRFLVEVDRNGSRNRRHRKARDVKMRSRDRSARGALPRAVKPCDLAHPHDSSPPVKPKKRRRDWSWRPGFAEENTVIVKPAASQG